MSSRGIALLKLADQQITELRALLAGCDDAVLYRACPGRAKLGDGTVGATALHTAENYDRIAVFLRALVDGQEPPAAGQHGDQGDQGDGIHHLNHLRAQDARISDLRSRLSAVLQVFGVLASLTAEQLELVPPAGGMRFSDGQRTLEEIVGSLLKHQRHQVDALRTAVDERPRSGEP